MVYFFMGGFYGPGPEKAYITSTNTPLARAQPYVQIQLCGLLGYVVPVYEAGRAQIGNDGGDSRLSLPQTGYSFQFPARVSNSLLFYSAFI